jgi:hypothetical protein
MTQSQLKYNYYGYGTSNSILNKGCNTFKKSELIVKINI